MQLLFKIYFNIIIFKPVFKTPGICRNRLNSHLLTFLPFMLIRAKKPEKGMLHFQRWLNLTYKFVKLWHFMFGYRFELQRLSRLYNFIY